MTGQRTWYTVQSGAARQHVGPITWLGLAAIGIAAVLAIRGLPHVPLPMPTWELGVVTPTCGLTRATVAITRGDLATAWNYNPAAYLLAVFAVAVIARLIVGLVSGKWINAAPVVPTVVWIGLIAIWWANQQMHAELIINTQLT